MIAHNISFDMKGIISSFMKCGAPESYIQKIRKKKQFCTMLKSTSTLKLPKKKGGFGWKWPSLNESYQYYFHEDLSGAHDALVDVEACAKIFFELKRGSNDCI